MPSDHSLRTTDYDVIILGQGIAGTLLSWQFKERGLKVMVIDQVKTNTASHVASAVLNPVNGKALWKTKRIEEQLPAAIDTYRQLEKKLDISLLQNIPILLFHQDEMKRDYFQQRQQEIPDELEMEKDPVEKNFQNDFGVGKIRNSYLLKAHDLLDQWRLCLKKENQLLEEHFDWTALKLENNFIRYHGITARKLICCEGALVKHNPYFKNLSFTRNKGEALILSIPGLARNFMYQKDVRIVPWYEDLFWVGTNQVWDFEDEGPTQEWYRTTEILLNSWLKIPFEITGHIAAERPTVAGQIPFVGFHPEYPQVGILNGMGTRGYSSAPFYAGRMAAMVTGKIPAAIIPAGKFHQ